jgi:enamidase
MSLGHTVAITDTGGEGRTCRQLDDYACGCSRGNFTMSSLLIVNLGAVVSGDWRQPLHNASSIYIEDGRIAELPSSRSDADTIIDARGLIAAPGLIDTHVHPTFGDFTPTQNSVGWQQAYLHGGVTSLVSAGELHVPGLPLENPEPKLFKYLSVLAKRCADNLTQHGPRLYAGTLLLTPGLTEADFDEIAAEGVGCVKFIFYPYGDDEVESENYVRWCHERNIVVKIHTGGVSRSGVSRPAGYEVLKAIQPDVAAHITGGPIPMPLSEMEAVVKEMPCTLEIATAGSFRRDMELMQMVHKAGALDRIIVGTDTPSGTGVLPRAMLRNVALLASLCDVSPAVAWCLATGNAARAHRLEAGLLQEGKPADLVLIGSNKGSEGKDGLDGLTIGDIPGISFVIVNGEIVVRDRSEQTPPPETLAVIEKA